MQKLYFSYIFGFEGADNDLVLDSYKHFHITFNYTICAV